MSQKPVRALAWLLAVFERKQENLALKDLLAFWSNVCATPAQSEYLGCVGAEKRTVGLPTQLCKPLVLQGLGYYGYIRDADNMSGPTKTCADWPGGRRPLK